MATATYNPEVTDVYYSAIVPASELEKIGWDFDTDTDNLDIRLTFEGENGKCFWAFCIDGSDREDSGDDNKSLEDLLYLISNNIIPYNENDDYSTNENGDFCNWILL
jgi:hypothetical protein